MDKRANNDFAEKSNKNYDHPTGSFKNNCTIMKDSRRGDIILEGYKDGAEYIEGERI